jgi:hypothetical protein
MKQMRLMAGFGTGDCPTPRDVYDFYMDFQAMLDLATERGYGFHSIRQVIGEVRIVWWLPGGGIRSFGYHPTLHAAIKAEIERLEKP